MEGGSWFGKCGDTGNRKFLHSWSDGIAICKGRGKLITFEILHVHAEYCLVKHCMKVSLANADISIFVESVQSLCPRCGATRQAGTSSCCVEGGSWFEKCGDPGDRKFLHSWSDGIMICEGRGK